jgi:ParB/RepB/Spo0J family partition protein
MDYMQLTKEMLELDIDEIRTNPHQPREYFDKGKLRILADSIIENGLDTPIEVVWDKRDDGKKATLKDGERRLRALKMAGYTKLRYGKEYFIIEVKDDAELEYRGLIANCMREDLQPVEKGKALLKILERRGIENVDMAINSVNRAKDWVDNGLMAEPSSRNYFISGETIELVAKDMKMIGVSGTNAVDLLKITRLPKDIQQKIFFAPPNTKIAKEKMKINRRGDLTKRKGNDRGEFIPISFGRELARLDDDKIIRFFLRMALRRNWTQRKLTMMVNDFVEKKLSPDVYITMYEQNCDRSIHAKDDEINHLMLTMDKMASTLTSWRTINLVAIADAFKQKEFAVTSRGLLTSTMRLKEALEKVLLNTEQLEKVKEQEKKFLNIPFHVDLTTPPKQRWGYRFSIPSDIGQKINAELGDTLEIMIVAVVKPTGEKRVQQISRPPVETTKKQQK